MPLTDNAIRSAKAAAKPHRLYDTGGLYLEVAPSGGKWWRFKYRFADKEKLISLGVYPEITLKNARNRRDENRRLLAEGIDPSEHRKAMKTVKSELVTSSLNWIDWKIKRAVRRFDCLT